jgi:hypothetical protein
MPMQCVKSIVDGRCVVERKICHVPIAWIVTWRLEDGSGGISVEEFLLNFSHLLVPQCLNRVETCRALGGQISEDDSDSPRKHERYYIDLWVKYEWNLHQPGK